MAGTRGMGFPTGDAENNGWQLYITSLVMIITAGIFVVARFITRYWYHKFGWDDAAILLSLVNSRPRPPSSPH